MSVATTVKRDIDAPRPDWDTCQSSQREFAAFDSELPATNTDSSCAAGQAAGGRFFLQGLGIRHRLVAVM